MRQKWNFMAKVHNIVWRKKHTAHQNLIECMMEYRCLHLIMVLCCPRAWTSQWVQKCVENLRTDETGWCNKTMTQSTHGAILVFHTLMFLIKLNGWSSSWRTTLIILKWDLPIRELPVTMETGIKARVTPTPMKLCRWKRICSHYTLNIFFYVKLFLFKFKVYLHYASYLVLKINNYE